MHNGSMKNLEEVIAFYDRGGNLDNREHFGTFVFEQIFTREDKNDLLAFLLTLTDQRVLWEKAPFDHPALAVPHGSKLNNSAEQWINVPAVGRSGRTSAQGALKPFTSFLGRTD
jgi:hypothetical protein